MAGGPKDIFLSYGREPEVIYFVQKLKQDLEGRGFSVWLDTDDIISGSDWHGALGTALDSCKAVIPVMTQKYISSHFCKGELYMANSERKLIFPIFLEDVDLSANELTRGVKFIISGVNWTMFRSGVEDYNNSLEKLIQGLNEKGLRRGTDAVDAGNLPDQMTNLHLTDPNSMPSAPLPTSTSPYQPQHSPYGGGYYPTTTATFPSPPQPYFGTPSPNNPAYHHTQHPAYPPQVPGYGYPPPPAPGYPPATSPAYFPIQGNVAYPPASTGFYQPPPVPYQSHPGGQPQYQTPYVPPTDIRSEPPPPYAMDPPDATKEVATELPKKEKLLDKFKVGTKLEAVDQRFPYFICVATVMDRSDDDMRVQVHFDGWGPEYNYWCDIGDVELHPAGWCKKHGWELQQPLNQPRMDWQTYLKDTHSEQAPEELFNENQLAGPGSLSFEVGMKIEAKKKLKSSSASVATIADVQPGKVKVHFDGCGSDQDFWCSNFSTEIHPPMWCSKVMKVKAESPKGYGSNFRWNEYLADSENRPAPAHLFTQDQLSDSTSAPTFRRGMRLEAKDRLNPHLVAVATVDNVKDGNLLIHFDGWGTRFDYWCTPDCEDMHPMGWCEKNGRPLQPPKGYSAGDFSWSTYLSNASLEAAPESLFTPAQMKGVTVAAPTTFQADMKLEAKDRKHPSLVCVATVKEVSSRGQLLIHFDGWGPEYDYWCEPTTTDIHPAGWCKNNQHVLQPPHNYHISPFIWKDYRASSKSIAAPESLFTSAQMSAPPSAQASGMSFKPDMKLEAKDRLNPNMICVATITEVRNGQLLIHFDGWSNRYDYWCDPTTPDIHPMGWCSKTNTKLHSPNGFSGEFKWPRYLTKTGSTAAPKALFKKGQSPEPAEFKAGMKLEAKDRRNPTMTCVATVENVQNGKLLIHFDGWGSNFDYWCEPGTPDIHPIGWCKKTGHTLHSPRGHRGQFNWSDYLASSGAVAAPEKLFENEKDHEDTGKFEVGMKLEAKDRLNPLVCVATITDIKKKKLLIHFDGWSNTYDYWCDPWTTDIHPVGWCERNGHDLQAPKDYYGEFDWDYYLEEELSEDAPATFFTNNQRN